MEALIYLIGSGKDDLTVLGSSHSLVPLAQKEYLIRGADHRNFLAMKAYDESINEIYINKKAAEFLNSAA